MKNNWDGLQYTNDTLCHSSGPWKNHKYIKKIGEGANAVYQYARKNITGGYYKDLAEERKKQVEEDRKKIYRDHYIDEETGHELQGASKEWSGMGGRGVDQYFQDVAELDRAEEKYNKTPGAKLKKTIEKGKNFISELFKH